LKLEKKNKIIETELKDVIKEYEDLKTENFKLNTAISMMDEHDEMKLRVILIIIFSNKSASFIKNNITFKAS
jgi:hypothetical protein